MRHWFALCVLLLASEVFAQTNSTLLQRSFLSQAVVTTPSGTEPITLSGTLVSLIDLSPASGSIGSNPSVHVSYVANANGIGELTGTSYQAFSLSSVQGTVALPGTFAWSFDLHFTSPTSATGSAPVTMKGIVNVDVQGKATLLSVPPSGLVGWWQAEGNATDTLGLNSGVLGELVSFVPGQIGQAFSFAEHGYVEVPPAPSLQAANVTAMAWVRHAGVPGHDNYVLAQGAQGCVAASYAIYTGSGNLNFYISDGSTFVESPDAGASVWDGNWHFVVGTYDGQFVRMFVDGLEVGSGTPTNLAINYSLQYTRFDLGAYRGSCELRFNGDVDEVRIFNRALTDVEIASAFNASTATETIPNNGAQSVSQSELQAAIDAGTAQPISFDIKVQQAQAQIAQDQANQATISNYLQANPQLTTVAKLFATEPVPSATVIPDAGSWKVRVPGLASPITTMGRSQKMAAMAQTITDSVNPAVQLNLYTNLYNALPAEYLESFNTLGISYNPPVSPSALANSSLEDMIAALARLSGDWLNVNDYTKGNLPLSHDVPCQAEIGYQDDYAWAGDGVFACVRTFSTSGIMANFEFPLKHFQTCVKWQGNRNTCHIFGNTSAVEMMVAENGIWKVNLSEQDFMEHYRGKWYPHFQDDGGVTGESVSAAIANRYSFPYESDWIYNPSFFRTADTLVVPLPLGQTIRIDTAYHDSCTRYPQWCSDSASQAPQKCSGQNCAYYDPGVPGSGYRITGFDDFWHYDNLDLSMTILLLEVVVHHGVVLGFESTPNFSSGGIPYRFGFQPHPGFILYDPNDAATHQGGHVVHVVGFISDADLHAKLPNAPSTPVGWFIVKNSWSTCWGDNGYAYMAWDYVKNQANGALAINGVN